MCRVEDAEKLTISDAENAQKAILNLILQYSKFPNQFRATNKNVKWNSIEEGTSIGIFPLPGAKYIKRYINGSYKAQMPFQIVYRSSPGTNNDSIGSQEVLEELGSWLEKAGIEFKDKQMELESINRTSPVFSASQDVKKMDYAVNMQLKYIYKNGR